METCVDEHKIKLFILICLIYNENSNLGGDSMANPKTFRNNLYILKIILEKCPQKLVLHIGINSMKELLKFFVGIYFLKLVFSIIEKGESFEKLVIVAFIMLVLNFIKHLISSWYSRYYSNKLDLKIEQEINLLLFQKAELVDLECYENPQFYNKYYRAIEDTNKMAKDVVDNIASLISMIISFVVIIIFTITIDPIIIIFNIFPFISVFTQSKANKARYNLNMELTQDERVKNYVKGTIFSSGHAKELRTTNVFNVLNKQFVKASKNKIDKYKKYGKNIALLVAISTFTTTTATFVGANLYAVYRFAIKQDLLISNFAILVSTISSLNGKISRILKYLITANEHSMYIENVREFLEYKPKIKNEGDSNIPALDTISFENLSFKYLGQNKYTLKNLNFTIHKGEKIALVGHNGAGKSTLIKLLLRLYDPVEGRILLNDRDIKEYKPEAYREMFGTIFQDYKIYSLTVGENVLMKTVHREEEDNVIKSLKLAGVDSKVNSLDKGINSILTREFDEDGVILSGGEYQKVALARMYAKDFEVAILDEPSSALDPIAEYEMYESLINVTKDKTMIFISHRLSSAILADKIYMLENGEIIEEGNHIELIKKDGKYAEMFKMQSEKYIEEGDLK